MESVKHYLLECPLYIAERQELLLSISFLHVVNCEVLLFGSRDISPAEQKVLMTSVQDFILRTKRFT